MTKIITRVFEANTQRLRPSQALEALHPKQQRK